MEVSLQETVSRSRCQLGGFHALGAHVGRSPDQSLGTCSKSNQAFAASKCISLYQLRVQRSEMHRCPVTVSEGERLGAREGMDGGFGGPTAVTSASPGDLEGFYTFCQLNLNNAINTSTHPEGGGR